VRPSELVLGLRGDLGRLERLAEEHREGSSGESDRAEKERQILEEQLERAQSEAGKAVARAEELRTEIGSLREKLERAESEAQEAAKLRGEATASREELARANSEIEQLRSENGAADGKARADRAEEAVRLLRREREEIRKTLLYLAEEGKTVRKASGARESKS